MAESEESPSETALLTTSTVLMPGTRLTYQVEAEDTRERVEEALYRDGELVVARTATGDRDGELPEIATRSEILDAARPHPSRLMVVLGGNERVRIDAESVDDDGRVGWSSVGERAEDDRASRVRAGDVLGLLERVSDRGIELANSVRGDLEDAPPSTVADVVASIAFEDPERHQDLLEEPNVLTRLECVAQQLDRLLEDFDEQ